MRTPFRFLFENRIIDRELLDPLKKMVKFRNIVVHQYEAVDAEIVVNILGNHLTDFLAFKEAILQYLRKG